jgi:hypothetical protein
MYLRIRFIGTQERELNERLIYCSENIIFNVTWFFHNPDLTLQAHYNIRNADKKCLTTEQISIGATFVCTENRFDVRRSRTHKTQFVLEDISHHIYNCNHQKFFCLKVL